MKGFVYFLKSGRVESWIYVGSTNNLPKRLKEHREGKSKATMGFRPLTLVYGEEFSNIEKARKREYYLKGWKGRIEKKDILANL